jgi:hypothetical protein
MVDEQKDLAEARALMVKKQLWQQCKRSRVIDS